jgi:hypothetical protein
MSAAESSVTDEGYGVNIGRFIADHPGWQVSGLLFGYTARKRDALGRPRGKRRSARTLDGLAAKLATA